MFETEDKTSVVYAKHISNGRLEAGAKLVFTRLDDCCQPIGRAFRATIRMDSKGRFYIMSAGRRHYHVME